MQKSHLKLGEEVGRFAGHVFTGLALFLVLVIATLVGSVVLDCLVSWFHDAYIVDGLKLAKRVLFTMELVFLVIWVAYSMWVALRALLFGKHEDGSSPH